MPFDSDGLGGRMRGGATTILRPKGGVKIRPRSTKKPPVKAVDKPLMKDRDWEYWRAIAGFFANNDQFPSYAALGLMLGVRDTTARKAMLRLERAGIVARNDLNKFKRGRMWPDNWEFLLRTKKDGGRNGSNSNEL